MARFFQILGVPFPSRSASTTPIDTSGSFFNPEFFANDFWGDDMFGM